jgi:signal transduction histidine kinase
MVTAGSTFRSTLLPLTVGVAMQLHGATALAAAQIPPTAEPSRLFVIVLGVGAGVALLVLLYRLRVGQARLRERERVARDLHDTVLQTAQGLILKLTPLASNPALPPPLRDRLDEAIDVAERLIVQARDKIQGLRSNGMHECDLAAALARVRDEATNDDGAAFSVVADGAARALHPQALDGAYLIAREAILNAFRHAGARAIEVEVIYAPEALRVHVRDDGAGLRDHAAPGAKTRHWGLRGMAERAESLGGTLEIWSRRGAGTEIRFALAAQRAYADGVQRSWWAQRPW